MRELCGSNHATPLKLEVELTPFMDAWDLLAMYNVCSDVPAFNRTEHVHVQLHDMRSMRLHTWEQCRHGGIAAGSLCSWAARPPLCKLWRKVPTLGCVCSCLVARFVPQKPSVILHVPCIYPCNHAVRCPQDQSFRKGPCS